MGVVSLAESRLNQPGCKDQPGIVVAEIEGLIRVYKDGRVDRPPVVAEVPCGCASETDIVSRHVVINKLTNQWARAYAPRQAAGRPLVIYLHGGGFCLGSAAWKCYHEFLAKLASQANCVIISVNYRLAPENRLPAAYEDGLSAVEWVRRQALGESWSDNSWWCNHCDFSRVFIAGDSAGANITHNVVARISHTTMKPLSLRGIILIQPFFGGEAQVKSEKTTIQQPNSALTLAASDTFWQLALPLSAMTNRDHPWCNPLSKKAPALDELHLPPVLVCISEMDILRDRNLEFCAALRRAGKRVDHIVYNGVGHAFQVLHNSPFSNIRTSEMISHISTFINK